MTERVPQTLENHGEHAIRFGLAVIPPGHWGREDGTVGPITREATSSEATTPSKPD